METIKTLQGKTSTLDFEIKMLSRMCYVKNKAEKIRLLQDRRDEVCRRLNALKREQKIQEKLHKKH